MMQKDANDSPHSNAPGTPTEDSHLEPSMTRMEIAAVETPVGHEFTLTVNAHRRRSV
jgi:hypothetical protein